MKAFESKIAKIYAGTAKTTVAKAEKYIQSFSKLYEQRLVQAQTMTGIYSGMTPAGAQTELKKWLAKQMDTPAWRGVRAEIASQITKGEIAAAGYADTAIYRAMLDSTTESMNFIMDGARQAGLSGNWHVYNRRSVERLIKKNVSMLPKVQVYADDSAKYYERKIQQVIQSGIIRGTPLAKLSNELIKVTKMSENTSMRAVRTAMTGARNAGIELSFQEAHDKYGLEMEKEWIAAVDDRTRDSHAEMDGERVPYDEPFSNGLMYPGDPSGDPAEVWNCRCTMRAIFKGINDK